MKVRVETTINAPIEKVWQTITEIEKSVDVIDGIKKIEVLNKPKSGLKGFKWRETREMFGKEATEVMWVTEEDEPNSYHVRAESHGSIYLTTMSLEQTGDGVDLAMEFEGQTQSIGAKIMWGLTGWMFKRSTVKALEKDLADIKAHCEAN